MNLKTLFLVTLLVTVVTVLATPVATAQGTSDEETPANEGVCDDLIGSTPGLYGLCVGFCEAQDCVATIDQASGELTFDPSCKPSSEKLLTNYNKRAQPGDPPMPCVNVVEEDPCPCWTRGELTQVSDDLDGDGTRIQCGPVPNLSGHFSINGRDEGSNSPFDLALAAPSVFGAPACQYIEQSHPTGGLVSRFMTVTLDEILSCIASIEAECAARGF
jgi:hypothetical protein